MANRDPVQNGEKTRKIGKKRSSGVAAIGGTLEGDEKAWKVRLKRRVGKVLHPVAVMLTRCIYRIRVLHRERLPAEGGALLVANHASWADPFTIMATTRRHVTFLIDRDVLEAFAWIKPLMRLYGVVSISKRDTPKQMMRSLKEARRRLDEGELVCIFPEGRLTRSGIIGEFKIGYRHILKGSTHPIIPVYLGGLWGSIFSFYGGVPGLRRPSRWPYPVTVVYGQPMPPETEPVEARAVCQELSVEYFQDRRRLRRPLAAEFIRTARKHWRRKAMSDTLGTEVTFGKALIRAVALAGALRGKLSAQPYVGILCPTSVAGALANIAVSMLGYVPVNLNYTASAEAFRSSIEQCAIDRFVASRRFLEKLGMEPPGETIYLEDLPASIGKMSKLLAWLKATLVPARWVARVKGFHADEVATVLFSSGTTATPKGVMLSHHNLLSNIEQAKMVLRPKKNDDICGCLPFFHSFGLTVTLWWPLLSGVGVSYHANPLEGRQIGKMVRERQCTILLATPTFLQGYVRRAAAEDFKSVRLCLTGAEKLTQTIADRFEEKFGIRPLEGYGTTELSPLVSVNLPDPDHGEGLERGSKAGTVGRPVPGVVPRVFDPETWQNGAAKGTGVLAIKGPNVMRGYLNQPEKTAEVMRDGWYFTGDLATLDEEGFIHINDRLSRFSKIGGEMIPHLALEDVLLRHIHTENRVVGVTGIYDEGNRERLAVVYTEEAGSAESLHKILAESDLPNLWKPARDAYVRVDEIPILGSGKLDLKRLRELAREGFMGYRQ